MKPGTVGIMPPGALGVSLFFHLSGELLRPDPVSFIALDGSRSAEALRAGFLQIAVGQEIRQLPGSDLIFPSLEATWASGALPEILIVCPNPDQLLPMLSTIVALIERMSESENGLESLKLPIMVLSSNGIYFQRVRQLFIEKLEESTLLGRLPDLWPEKMPYIVGRLIRGVTVQTGVRHGTGSSAIYYPGPRNVSTLVGGERQVRERCQEVLTNLGGWFELAQTASPTRLEFEKAIINLVANFLGLQYAFDRDGRFRALTIAEILVPEHQPEIRELALRVFEIGRAVKAFTPSDHFEDVLREIMTRAQRIPEHIPSSLQWIELQMQEGRLEVKLPPTEAWLIEPLIHYGRSGALVEAVAYFERQREELLAKIRLAVERIAAGCERRATGP